MLKNKWLLLSAVICISTFNCANANLAISDLTAPKSPAYRVGISEIPENRYVETKQDNANIIEKTVKKELNENKTEENDTLYSELNIKRLSKEVAADLEFEEQDMVSDLTLLWQGAAMQSDTINFALYKLANPDEGKPNKSTVKNILKSIASMSSLVGAGMANPLLAGTSLIGGNILGIMTQDTKALNYKYTKVTDADMIILIRKVEDLQQQAVNLYYDYMTAKKQFEMTTKLAQERQKRFELAQKNNSSKELIVITDAYFRTSLEKQRSARSEFLSKRAALEQFVGNEAFTQFEKELAAREKGETVADSEKNADYEKTVQSVENYTNNLNNKTASLYGVGEVEEDKNLSQLEPITPLETAQKTEETVTETAKDTVKEAEKETETDAPKAKTSKKSKDKSKEKTKKEEKKEKPVKEKKQKQDRYSTKGLIFLHDTEDKTQDVQPEEQKPQEKAKKEKKQKQPKTQTPQTTKPAEQTQPAAQPKPQTPAKKTTTFYGVELMPLDDIRVPDLKPNGYSIFAR